MATKLRILIRWGGLPRRFLSLVFRDGPAEDGTLLISLDRKPTLSLDVELGRLRPPIAPEPPLQPFKITYHATGCVRFHGFDRGAPRRIFAEPIFAISQAQPLAIVSLPHPDVLTVFDEIAGPFDAEFDLSSADLGRKTFYLSLLPDSDQLPGLSATGASVRFADWFQGWYIAWASAYSAIFRVGPCCLEMYTVGRTVPSAGR